MEAVRSGADQTRADQTRADQTRTDQIGADQIGAVRRFNRTVTQRVGALDDEYMARGRPLAQARLLWEIGPGGAEVAALRARLGLDSGYLSRLLRTLERDGLVTVGPTDPTGSVGPTDPTGTVGPTDPTGTVGPTNPTGTVGPTNPTGRTGSAVVDRRVRSAALTAAGRREWAELDQRSDELVRSILEPLTERRRERLVAAMAEVERLLMASMVVIRPCPPGDPQARACMRAYAREISGRFDDGFDPALSTPVHDEELLPPAGVFLLATLNAEPVGCGALKLHRGAPAEIKRVWVADTVRGLGIGRRMLDELERYAADRGRTAVRLDTNRNLTEAIALYRSAGYREIEPYNTERYAHHWFEKHLTPANS